MEELEGRILAGKIRIESAIGEGAMGTVHRAQQIALGTTLAVKVMHRRLTGDPAFAARFLREAQAASRVDHPCSIRVLDYGEEPDGLLWMAMELVEGRTLADVLFAEGPMGVSRVVHLASQVLAALAVAHEMGVVHRDLKPENILVLAGQDDEGRPTEVVKVCDFGVAKMASSSGMTMDGVLVGTPEYMSPEQARGAPLDARADIYAMGVILFEMMTGTVPFDGATPFSTAFLQVTKEPMHPHLINPAVDSRLEEICMKAMKKDPNERHGSARELRGELRALAPGGDVVPARNERVERVSSHGTEAPPGPVPGSLTAQLGPRPRSAALPVLLATAALLAGGIFVVRRMGLADPAATTPVATTVTKAELPLASAAAALPSTGPTARDNAVGETRTASLAAGAEDATGAPPPEKVTAPVTAHARPRVGLGKANARKVAPKAKAKVTPAPAAPGSPQEEALPEFPVPGAAASEAPGTAKPGKVPAAGATKPPADPASEPPPSPAEKAAPPPSAPAPESASPPDLPL